MLDNDQHMVQDNILASKSVSWYPRFVQIQFDFSHHPGSSKRPAEQFFWGLLKQRKPNFSPPSPTMKDLPFLKWQPANSRWVSQKTLVWTLTRNRTATLEQGSGCDFLHRHQDWRETKVRFAWRMTVRLLLLYGLPRVKNSHTEAVVIWTVEEICFIHYATLAQTKDDREVCLMDNVQGRRFSIPFRNFSTFYSGISFCSAQLGKSWFGGYSSSFFDCNNPQLKINICNFSTASHYLKYTITL